MNSDWWKDKRYLWLDKVERLRQRRRARKFARLASKERERNLRELEERSPSLWDRLQEWQRKKQLAREQKATLKELEEGGPTLTDRLKELQRKQQLASEQKANLDQLNPDDPLIKKHENKVFWAFALLAVLGFLAYFASVAVRHELAATQEAEDKRTLARVNGEPIYVDTVLERLFFDRGPVTLQEISRQTVVRQEAEKNKVVLSGEELEKIDRLLSFNPRRKVEEPRMRTALLLRKLILRELPKGKRQEVYQTYKADVKTYVVSAASFESLDKASRFLREISEGKSIEDVASRLTLEAKMPKHFGDLTEEHLVRLFGGAVKRAVVGLEAGEYSLPVHLYGKFLVFRLDAVKTDFEEVTEAIDTIIVEAEAPAYMLRLMESATIDSPLMDPSGDAFKENADGPFATPSSTPVSSAVEPTEAPGEP